MSQLEVEFSRPEQWQIDYIADNMRRADIEEVRAASGYTPIESLMMGVTHSDYSTVACVNGVPCVIFGLAICNLLTGAGVPWMLGTDEVLKYKKKLMRYSRKTVDEMLIVCPTLFNYVHADNTVSINWLGHLGFTIAPAVRYGNGMFHPFSKSRR